MNQPAHEIDMDNLPGPSNNKSKRGVSKHIPIEILIELHNKNNTEAEIGKIVNCSAGNVGNRLRKAGIKGLKLHINNRADILALNSKRILDEIGVKSLKKIPLRELTTSYGILYDKEALQRGEATSIVRYDPSALRERYDQLRAMMADVIDVTPQIEGEV